MSTAITTSVDSRFISAASVDCASSEPVSVKDLTYITIPSGGSTVWTWRNAANEDFSAKTLVGLIVCLGNPQLSLWPFTVAKKNSLPLLVAPRKPPASRFDPEKFPVAYRIGDDYGDLDRDVIESARNPDGTYDAEKIPYFQWERQTSPDGRTINIPPRAKLGRTVGLLREGDLYPVFVRLPGTSVAALNSFISGLRSSPSVKGIPIHRVIVEFGLERRSGKESDYSVLKPSLAQGDKVISEEAGRIIEENYTHAFSGVVNFQPPAPAAAPAAAPATETIPF